MPTNEDHFTRRSFVVIDFITKCEVSVCKRKMNVGIGPFEKKSLFQSNVCRLCSSIRDKLLPIFDNSGSKVDIKIKECLPSLDVSYTFYFDFCWFYSIDL